MDGGETTHGGETGLGSAFDTDTDTEASTDTDTDTDTGEPSEGCDCADDQLCVAQADDFCGPEFGYVLHCVPALAACDEGACNPDCLDAICGNSLCPPPCGDVPGVDVWCTVGGPPSCDPIAQDCPEGEKCVAWASSGRGLDANKCTPIMGDQMPGEPCIYTGPVEAADDCNAASACFDVDFDVDPPTGTCHEFCGPEYACPAGQSCLVAHEGTVALCVENRHSRG